MQFKEILTDIGNDVMYNLHAHTQFCDARAPMDVLAREAHHTGFTHFGFTPHSPIPIDSPCNMSIDDVPRFFAEIDRLNSEYPDVKFYKGMEIDFLGEEWGPANDYFKSLGLDYAIGSVHFIRTPESGADVTGDFPKYVDIDGRPDSFIKKLALYFDNDLRYVVDTYFDAEMEMLQMGGFDIVGHFDKIKLNASYCDPDIEKYDWYNTRVNALIDTIIEKGYAVEINTKSWAEFHHFFPAQRHWKRLSQSGIDIVVNSDAHYPDTLNAARPDVIKALRYLNGNTLTITKNI